MIKSEILKVNEQATVNVSTRFDNRQSALMEYAAIVAAVRDSLIVGGHSPEEARALIKTASDMPFDRLDMYPYRDEAKKAMEEE